MTNPSTVEERIRSKIRITPTGCWEFLGSRIRHGYGRIYVNGRQAPVHRVMYEAMRGAIPDGLVLDHLCRNPPCCNPDHLEPVTQKVNLYRGMSPTIQAHLSGVCARGHAFAIHGYTSPRGKRHCRICNQHTAERRSRERQAALDQRTCTVCDAPLVGKTARAKYCSDSCRFRRPRTQLALQRRTA